MKTRVIKRCPKCNRQLEQYIDLHPKGMAEEQGNPSKYCFTCRITVIPQVDKLVIEA